MLREILENTEGANVYAVIGLIFFVILFAGIIIWILRKDKSYLREMKNLPLENDDSLSSKNTNGDNNEIK